MKTFVFLIQIIFITFNIIHIKSDNLRKPQFNKISCNNNTVCLKSSSCQDGVIECICGKDGFCHFD